MLALAAIMVATFGAVIATRSDAAAASPGRTAEQYPGGQGPTDDLPEAVREAESVGVASR